MKENDESSKCSANKYSAYQMRVASKACYEAGHRTVAGMLQQAAEVMEREETREKKYEYATKWDDGKIDGISTNKDEVTDSISFVEYISSISADDKTGCKLVRRSVGEWEEVDDVQQ